MKTKIICLLVALVAMVSVLASCDGNGGEGGGENNGNGEIVYDYTWNETKITAELNMDDNSEELSSGTQRYYAGEDLTQTADIDKSIYQRNKDAEAAAGVKVTYTYLEDDMGYVWGKNVDKIQLKVKSGDTDAPDIYCNFAYDMTCAALRGCFANLLKEDYKNGNYFLFTDDDYDATSDNFFDAEAGKGYFYQYMESLSLDPDNKIYCLASNYCTDMVRSFLVVPVNVTMMNGIDQNEASKIVGGDRNNDNVIDVLDFYEYVWEGNWTYETLAAYSGLVYQNANSNPGADIGDTLGFCLATTDAGLVASGVLYTSSVKIITQDETGKYIYGETNSDLNKFVTALKNLMEQRGVATASKSDFTSNLGYTPATTLVGIRERFAQNKLLFGGIIAVGSLEDEIYQEMRSGLGFGVVPVPVYQENDEYLTLVHNVARIVGISYTSTNFSQCSAFLDYVSRTSADILDQYYNSELTAKTGGVAGENNALMLTYIRNHVRDCFDKSCEDMIANNMATAGDTKADDYRWHDIIWDRGYKIDDFTSMYLSLYAKKQGELDKIVKQWNELD